MTNPYRRVLFGALLGCIFWITGCSSSAVPINPGIQSQSPLGNTEASQSAPIAPQAAGQAAASLTTQSVSARPEVINCPQVSGKPSIACCSYVQSKLSGPSSACNPTPAPAPKPVGTFAPDSPGVDSSRRYPTSIGGGAIAQVSQGAVVGITWVCATTITYTPCPSSVNSNWSGSSNGLSVDFSSFSTSGGASTTEFFTTSASTPVGVYSANVCLSSQQNYSSAPICSSFLIQVISSVMQPIDVTSISPNEIIELQMAPANFKGAQILNGGHLYLEVYDNGVPRGGQYPLQAGPSGNPVGCCMVIQSYTQQVLADPGIDITSYVTNYQLAQKYNSYVNYQKAANVPNYNFLTFNSNSWTTGLLLSTGISEATIEGWVATLMTRSLLSPPAYTNGAPIIPCFQASVRLPLLQPLTSQYGGCAL